MPNPVDISGIKFGRLTAIRPALGLPKGKGRWWVCLCDCGNEKIVLQGVLKDGNTRSCGCLQKEKQRLAASRMMKRRWEDGEFVGSSNPSFKHGFSKLVEYSAWWNMILRCQDPSNPYFKDYGERGISVCPEWADPVNGFQSFLLSVGYKPKSNLSLQRIDNDGNYEPNNCKWATAKEQASNRRPPLSKRGKKWITNGVTSKSIEKNQPLPEGWRYGFYKKSGWTKRRLR
jgi:hypothetical protein